VAFPELRSMATRAVSLGTPEPIPVLAVSYQPVRAGRLWRLAVGRAR